LHTTVAHLKQFLHHQTASSPQVTVVWYFNTEQFYWCIKWLTHHCTDLPSRSFK